MPDYTLERTPGHREFWRVQHMEAVDDHPELLASLMPIFLTDEPVTVATWTARQRALDDERRLRAMDPARDVYAGLGRYPADDARAPQAAPKRAAGTQGRANG